MNNLRSAVTGRIRLDVSSFRADAQAIAAAARSAANAVQTSFNSIRTNPAELERYQQELNALRQSALNASTAGRTLGNSLKNLQQNFAGVGDKIREAQGYLLAWSAAAGVLVTGGIKAADNLELLNVRYTQLMGNQAAATVQMERIAAIARRLGAPVREVQREFAGLIPAVRDAGDNIEDYIALVLRLAALNPKEGIGGAVFAIREALVSNAADLISLTERFNLPRVQLRAIFKETGSFAKALDAILDRQGATQVTLDAQARSVSNLAAQIRDNLTQILERAFAPALEIVRDLLTAINNLLQTTPTWLVQLGAAVLTGIGAFSGLVLILEKVASAYAAVKAAALATAAAIGKTSPVIGRAGSALAAAAPRALAGAAGAVVGANIGIEIVRMIGRGTGNERLANQTLDDVFETGKQAIFLALYGLLELVKPLGYILVAIVNIFQNFQDSITIIFGSLKGAFGGLLTLLGDVVSSIGSIIGQGEAGAGISNEGRRLMDEAEAEIRAADRRLAESQAEGMSRVDAFILEAERGLYRAFFPVVEVAEEVVAVTRTWLDVIRDTLTDIVVKEAERFTAGFDRRIQFGQDLAELEEEGNQAEITARFTALERERRVIVDMLPRLAAFAEYSDEARKKLDEYNARLAQIAEELPQYAEAVRAASKRAVNEAAKAYADAVKDAEEARGKAIDKIVRDVTKQLADLDEDVAKKRQDQLDRVRAIEDEYNEAELEAVKDHRNKLLEIEEEFNRAAELAASSLDAAGVAAAAQRRDEALRKAGQEFTEAQEKAQERRDKQRQALVEELNDLQLYYDNRKLEILRAEADERAAVQEEFVKRLQDAKEAYEAQRVEIQQAADAQNAILRQAQQQAADDQLAIVRRAAEEEKAIRLAALGEYLAQTQAQLAAFLSSSAAAVSNFLTQNGITSPIAAAATAADVLGRALTPAPANATIAPTINIYDATNPQAVALEVRKEIIRLAGS